MCKDVYEIRAHGKEMEDMCETERYEGVAFFEKTLGNVGHALDLIISHFHRGKFSKKFPTHIDLYKRCIAKEKKNIRKIVSLEII